jgi:hypothetical protein
MSERDYPEAGTREYGTGLRRAITEAAEQSARSSEKPSVTGEAEDGHSAGVIGTLLKKHFSWDNLFVLLVGDGVGLSLCIAAGDAALKKDWGPMLAGFGVGLPLMAVASSFPIWKNRVAKWMRDSIVHVSTGGAAFIVLAVCIYVLGPYLLPQSPSPDQIAAAVVRAIPGSTQTTPTPPPAPTKAPLVTYPTISWNGGSGPIVLTGQYSRTGADLEIFIEWGALLTTAPVAGGFINWDGRRLPLETKERYVRNAQIKTIIGTVSEANGGNSFILQIGNDSGGVKIGISSASYLFRIVFVSHEGDEEAVLFALVGDHSVMDNKTYPAVILDPGVFLMRGNM